MGRLTRQFFRCTSDSSAAVDCAFLLGAMVEELGRIPSCQVRGKTMKSAVAKRAQIRLLAGSNSAFLGNRQQSRGKSHVRLELPR